MILVPGWPIALIIILETGALIWTHKRMSRYEQWALILPALAVAGVYLFLDFTDAPITLFIRNIVRTAFFFWFFWKTIILYVTRKIHY